MTEPSPALVEAVAREIWLELWIKNIQGRTDKVARADIAVECGDRWKSCDTIARAAIATIDIWRAENDPVRKAELAVISAARIAPKIHSTGCSLSMDMVDAACACGASSLTKSLRVLDLIRTTPMAKRADASAAWRNARTALVAPVESRLVPIEPTAEMYAAMMTANVNPPRNVDGSVSVRVQNKNIWDAALAAAPHPPTVPSDYDRAVEDCARVAETRAKVMRENGRLKTVNTKLYPADYVMAQYEWARADGADDVAAAIRALKKTRE